MDLKYDDMEKYFNKECKEVFDRRWKLFESRYNYSWDSFEFHAKQRISMFNFFIIFAGISANAIATLLRTDRYIMAGSLAIAGSVISCIFIFLDRRNEELVHNAEDNLRELEKDVIFIKYIREIEWPKRKTYIGKMEKRLERRQLGIHLREDADKDSEVPSRYEHGIWIPKLEFFIAALYLIAGGCLLWRGLGLQFNIIIDQISYLYNYLSHKLFVQ